MHKRHNPNDAMTPHRCIGVPGSIGRCDLPIEPVHTGTSRPSRPESTSEHGHLTCARWAQPAKPTPGLQPANWPRQQRRCHPSPAKTDPVTPGQNTPRTKSTQKHAITSPKIITCTHLIQSFSSGRLAHGDGMAFQAAPLLSPLMGFEASPHLTTSKQIVSIFSASSTMFMKV